MMALRSVPRRDRLRLAARPAEMEIAALLVATALLLGACSSAPPLRDAARRGDASEVGRLLADGNDPSASDGSGRTALHAAARRGHVRVARDLIEAGAPVDARNHKDRTPLHEAARQGGSPMVSLLLSRGADPDLQDDDRRTPLMESVAERDSESSRSMLEAGADPDLRDEDRETALHMAVGKGDLQLVELLLEFRANPNLPDEDGVTPALLAAEDRELEILSRLLAAGANANPARGDRVTALHLAVRNRDFDTARTLLRSGADPNTRDHGGNSPLLDSIRSRDPELTRLLIEHGAHVDVADRGGTTPLLAAVQARDRDAVLLLLDSGASPDIPGPDGATPIVVASRARDQEIVRILAEYGATTDSYDQALADPAAFGRRYGWGALANAILLKHLDDPFAAANAATRPTAAAPASRVPSGDVRPARERVATPAERAPRPRHAPFYSRRVAVVIGIDRYTSYPPLEGAVGDGRRVADALRGVGFDEVIEVYDEQATRSRLLRVLGHDLARRTDAETLALIYFAGHGETETLRDGGKRGYIVPIDGDPRASFATAISMHTLRSLSGRLAAKQIYYAMDSCYSGLGLVRGIRSISPDTGDYVRKVTSLPAVQMITAGGEGEQAIEQDGRGVFTTYFLRALSGEADFNEDGFVTASEIGAYVRPQVTAASAARQTPQFGTLEGVGEVALPVR